MTLILGQWPAKNSNMALEATCKKASQPFYELYEAAKNRDPTALGKTAMIEKHTFERESSPAYFVVLKEPIVFSGECHCFF